MSGMAVTKTIAEEMPATKSDAHSNPRFLLKRKFLVRRFMRGFRNNMAI